MAEHKRAPVSEEVDEYVTATQATQLLEVSKGKMAKMLKNGELPYVSDPRNERAKLIKRSDLEAWLAKAVRPKVVYQRRFTEHIHEQRAKA